MERSKSRYAVRFSELAERKERAFIPFVVLGDPDEKTSFEILKVLLKHADCLELGLPFSDPIADGKTIQHADQRALANGMNTDRAFSMVSRIRKLDRKTPMGLLVYYNLVYRRGIERFYRDAKRAGVDSILIADMPVEESGLALRSARKYSIDQVFLVTQATGNKRLRKIASKGSGFLYVVSLLGVTGARAMLEKGTLALVKRAAANSKLPLCVGFGVSKAVHIKALAKSGAHGAIVGSAVENLIARNMGKKRRMLDAVDRFCRGMKAATR